jgi:AraC-like DNA-binding protein
MERPDVLGAALRTCASVNDALVFGQRYLEVTASPWTIELAFDGDTAIVRFTDRAHGSCSVMRAAALAAVERVAELVLGPRFDRAATAVNANELRFPRGWLAEPLARPWRTIDVSADLHERTLRLLANPEHGFPGLEQAASHLRVSSRTLRRHLHERGTSFQAVRNDARRSHGCFLLASSDVALDDIAEALGYADLPGLIRAFRRLTGETPSSYRRRRRGVASSVVRCSARLGAQPSL